MDMIHYIFLVNASTDRPWWSPNLYHRECCNKHVGLSPFISSVHLTQSVTVGSNSRSDFLKNLNTVIYNNCFDLFSYQSRVKSFLSFIFRIFYCLLQMFFSLNFMHVYTMYFGHTTFPISAPHNTFPSQLYDSFFPSLFLSFFIIAVYIFYYSRWSPNQNSRAISQTHFREKHSEILRPKLAKAILNRCRRTIILIFKLSTKP